MIKKIVQKAFNIFKKEKEVPNTQIVNTSTTNNSSNIPVLPTTNYSWVTSTVPTSYTHAGGGGGSVWTASASGNWTNSSINQSLIINTSIINTPKRKINLDELYDKIELISDKLMIILDDPIIHEKYPTLKDAYDQYKVLNEIVKSDQPND